MESQWKLKVCVIGDQNIGKRSVIKSLFPSAFDKDYSLTTGLNIFTMPISLVDTNITISIWVLAGIPRFDGFVKQFTAGAHMFIFVYDITNPDSLSNLKRKWSKLTSPSANAQRILIGTHKDEKNKAQISNEEANALAHELQCSSHITTNTQEYDSVIEDGLIQAIDNRQETLKPVKSKQKVLYNLMKRSISTIGVLTGIFLLICIFGHISGLFSLNPDLINLIILPFTLFLSFFLGIVLMENKFTGINIPVRSNEIGRMYSTYKKLSRLRSKYYEKYHYYQHLSLAALEKRFGLHKTKWIIGAIGALEITTIIISALWAVNFGDPNLLKSFLILGGILLLTILFVTLALFGIFSVKKILDEEFLTLFRGRNAIFSIVCATLLFFIIGVIGLNWGWLSTTGLIFSLIFIVPLFMISTIQGKFFILFGLQQWYQLQNWNPLEGDGIYIPGKSIQNRLSGSISKIIPLIALFSLPISILGLALDYVNVLMLTDPVQGESLITDFLSSFPSFIVEISIILLSLGPLLILFIRPFNFIEIWANQGLYEKIGSKWDLESLDNIYRKYKTVVRIPRMKKQFSYNLILITSMALLLIALSNLAIIFKTEYPFLAEAIIFAELVTGIVFFINIDFSLFSFEEEKNFITFARIGKKFQRDFINETMYGESLLMNQDSKIIEWVNSTPRQWGVPYYFQTKYSINNLKKTWDFVPEIQSSKLLREINEEDFKNDIKPILEHLNTLLEGSTILLSNFLVNVKIDMGQVLTFSRRNSEAKNYLKDALSSRKDNSEVLFYLWLNSQLVISSSEHFASPSRYITDFVSEDDAWFILGRLFQLYEQNILALAAYSNALEANPELKKASLYYSLLYTLREKIDKKTENFLINHLEDDDNNIIKAAFDIIQLLNPKDRYRTTIKESVIANFKSPDSEIQVKSLEYFIDWPEDQILLPETINTLLDFLDSSDRGVRQKVVDIVKSWPEIYQLHEVTRSKILELTSTENKGYLKALELIGTWPSDYITQEKTLDQLKLTFFNENKEIRVEGLEVLLAWPIDTQKVSKISSMILEKIKDEKSEVREQALLAIVTSWDLEYLLNSSAKQLLLELFSSPHTNVRKKLLDIILQWPQDKQIERDFKVKILEGLSDPESEIQKVTIQILESWPKDFQEELVDKDMYQKIKALLSIKKIITEKINIWNAEEELEKIPEKYRWTEEIKEEILDQARNTDTFAKRGALAVIYYMEKEIQESREFRSVVIQNFAHSDLSVRKAALRILVKYSAKYQFSLEIKEAVIQYLPLDDEYIWKYTELLKSWPIKELTDPRIIDASLSALSMKKSSKALVLVILEMLPEKTRLDPNFKIELLTKLPKEQNLDEWYASSYGRIIIKEYNEAIHILQNKIEQGFESDTFSDRAHMLLARCHSELGQLDQSLEHIKKSFTSGLLELEPVLEKKSYSNVRSDPRLKEILQKAIDLDYEDIFNENIAKKIKKFLDSS